MYMKRTTQKMARPSTLVKGLRGVSRLLEAIGEPITSEVVPIVGEWGGGGGE